MIAIINYGLGNLASIQNMCMRLSIDAVITDNASEIRNASRLILPGVGNFKKGMEHLNTSGLKELITDEVLGKDKNILGICLGAQLMTRHSEEGNEDGLGWVAAETVRFDISRMKGLKVPHMGWEDINVTNPNPLLQNLPDDPRFYFVHAYHFSFSDQQQVSATSNYGYEFACAFRKDNIYGMQYHPEKSHKFGMKVLENFANI